MKCEAYPFFHSPYRKCTTKNVNALSFPIAFVYFSTQQHENNTSFLLCIFLVQVNLKIAGRLICLFSFFFLVILKEMRKCVCINKQSRVHILGKHDEKICSFACASYNTYLL